MNFTKNRMSSKNIFKNEVNGTSTVKRREEYMILLVFMNYCLYLLLYPFEEL